MTKMLMLKKLTLKKLTIKKVDDEKIDGKKSWKSWWWVTRWWKSWRWRKKSWWWWHWREKSWRWKSWRWRSWCWRLYLDWCRVHRLDSPLGCQPLLLTIVVDHLRFVEEMMIKIMLWWSGSTNVDFIDNNQWFSSYYIINHEEWKKNLYPSSCLFADDSRSKSNVKLSLRHWLNPNMLTLRFCIFFWTKMGWFCRSIILFIHIPQSCKNVPTVPTSWCYFFWPVLIFEKSTRKTANFWC